MSIETLNRDNELHQKSLALKADLELLREICTEPVPLVIFSPHSERMVQLDALPKLVCDMAMDVLICAFEREVAKTAAEFAALGQKGEVQNE